MAKFPAEITIGGFDIETTGLLSPEHRIVEACVIKELYTPSTHERKRLSCDTWRVNPKRKIDVQASRVHGITNCMVSSCPEWPEVAPHLVERLNECDIVVAHNGIDFDFPFLVQELDRIKHPLPDFNYLDTMQEGRFATPFGKAPNLAELCFACDVKYDTEAAHSAEYDVGVMLEAFFNGLRHGGFVLPSLS